MGKWFEFFFLLTHAQYDTNMCNDFPTLKKSNKSYFYFHLFEHISKYLFLFLITMCLCMCEWWCFQRSEMALDTLELELQWVFSLWHGRWQLSSRLRKNSTWSNKWAIYRPSWMYFFPLRFLPILVCYLEVCLILIFTLSNIGLVK